MMDCKRVRKYVGAFADGELEIHLNLEVLEHVRMCPECASRVTEITLLKTAIKRGYADVYAPSKLRARMLDMQPTSTLTGPHAPQAGKPRLVNRFFRLTVPLGLAAAVTFAAWIWPDTPQSEPPRGTITVVAGRVVDDVRQQHRMCLSPRGLPRHIPAGPPDRFAMARKLQHELNFAVSVPDLHPRGYKLVGADTCGIRGRPGAHVLYRALSDRKWLSLFTVERIREIASGTLNHAGDREYFVSNGPLSVVAWHQGPETHVLCAAMPSTALLKVADGVRLTGSFPTTPTGTFLASVTGQ